jgi:hypothetical protein
MELVRRDLGPDPFQSDGGTFRIRLGLARSSAMRSFSESSPRSATPLSMAS